MKQIIKKISVVLFAAVMVAPLGLVAQDKEEKDKKDKKEGEQIIITRKSNKDEKVVIEVNGDKVTVNGKPIDELKDGDITVRRNKLKDVWAYSVDENGLGQSWNQNFGLMNMDENRAMLGVTTEKADKGVEIQTISKESGAEKAGLKKGDVISKIDDQKIEDPDDLSKAIKAHKPGDKVSVTYLREGKEQKASAELGKWKGVNIRTYSNGNGQSYNYKMPDMNFEMPRIQTMPRKAQGYNSFSWSTGGPRLGVSVQDTEDGKGVKVIDVDEEGNGSKAGIKEDDIITEVDGKAVNSADEVAKIMKDSKDKISIKMKLLRNGKSETVDVKIPRKLKTTDL